MSVLFLLLIVHVILTFFLCPKVSDSFESNSQTVLEVAARDHLGSRADGPASSDDWLVTDEQVDLTSSDGHASQGHKQVSSSDHHAQQGGVHVSSGNHHAPRGDVHVSSGNHHAHQGDMQVSSGNHHAHQGDMQVSSGNQHDQNGDVKVSSQREDVHVSPGDHLTASNISYNDHHSGKQKQVVEAPVLEMQKPSTSSSSPGQVRVKQRAETSTEQLRTHASAGAVAGTSSVQHASAGSVTGTSVVPLDVAVHTRDSER